MLSAALPINLELLAVFPISAGLYLPLTPSPESSGLLIEEAGGALSVLNTKDDLPTSKTDSILPATSVERYRNRYWKPPAKASSRPAGAYVQEVASGER